jgi:molybdopterin converting factor small subunit
MTSEEKGKFISKSRMWALKVKVKLFGIFRNYLPKESEGPTFWMEIEEGDTLQEILTRLGIPEGEPKTLVHNHRAGKREKILADGDVVAIFPPVAGG